MLNRYLIPSVAFIAAFSVLCALGFWQLQRLAWKEALIERVEARFDLDPVPLPPVAAWSDPAILERFEYQPVAVTGAFVPVPDGAGRFERFYTYTLLAEPRGARGGQGYWVMNLFRPDDGGVLYVNRGFVPLPERGAESPAPVGRVTVTGVVRSPSTGNSFTPPCEPDASTCYVADIERAAGFAGIDGIAPFYLDLRAGGIAGGPSADDPGTAPQAGETRIAFPNSHLQYAVTWFGLAASLAGVFGFFMAGRIRRPGE